MASDDKSHSHLTGRSAEDARQNLDKRMSSYTQLNTELWEKLEPVRRVKRRMDEAFAPFQQLMNRIEQSIQSPSMQALLERCSRQGRVREILDKAGWLPHPTIPDELVLQAFENVAEDRISSVIEDYLSSNWDQVASVFYERISKSGADEETLETLNEALGCRREGFHRATCRTIFPEIERVVRLRMPPQASDKMTSLKEYRKALLDLPLSAVDGQIGLVIPVFEHIQEKCYSTFGKDSDDLGFRFPNRHAVAHGLRSYSSPQDSMNSLVIADFMLICVEAVKDLSLEN